MKIAPGTSMHVFKCVFVVESEYVGVFHRNKNSIGKWHWILAMFKQTATL